MKYHNGFTGENRRKENGKVKLSLRDKIGIMVVFFTVLGSGYGFYYSTTYSVADVIKDCQANTTNVRVLQTNNVDMKADIKYLVKKTDDMDTRQLEMLRVLNQIKGKLDQ